MLFKEKESVHWLEFELLADIPYLKHAIFLKQGGISGGDKTSLNLSPYVGDNPACVDANLAKVTKILSFTHLKWAKQIHGKLLTILTDVQQAVPPSDALATTLSSVGLLIHHADCQAAIIYDPMHHALAMVHCGWRGSVQNIYASTINSMQTLFGSRAEDLLIGISPSLGPENAEFIHYRQELPESFWQFQVKPNTFDFWAISEQQLLEAHVLKHHIQLAKIDTYANPNDYFSNRYNPSCGRHGTIAMLTPQG